MTHLICVLACSEIALDQEGQHDGSHTQHPPFRCHFINNFWGLTLPRSACKNRAICPQISHGFSPGRLFVMLNFRQLYKFCGQTSAGEIQEFQWEFQWPMDSTWISTRPFCSVWVPILLQSLDNSAASLQYIIFMLSIEC